MTDRCQCFAQGVTRHETKPVFFHQVSGDTGLTIVAKISGIECILPSYKLETDFNLLTGSLTFH